jgi:hypothetical protein
MGSRNSNGNRRLQELDGEIERYREAHRFRLGSARVDGGIPLQDPQAANRQGARPQPKADRQGHPGPRIAPVAPTWGASATAPSLPPEHAIRLGALARTTVSFGATWPSTSLPATILFPIRHVRSVRAEEWIGRSTRTAWLIPAQPVTGRAVVTVIGLRAQRKSRRNSRRSCALISQVGGPTRRLCGAGSSSGENPGGLARRSPICRA